MPVLSPCVCHSGGGPGRVLYLVHSFYFFVNPVKGGLKLSLSFGAPDLWLLVQDLTSLSGEGYTPDVSRPLLLMGRCVTGINRLE